MDYFCTICTDTLDIAQDKPVSISCGHTFHEKCLKCWLQVTQKCPLCKCVTRNGDIKILFFSTQKVSEETQYRIQLEAKLKDAVSKQKQTQDALKESQKSLKDARVITTYLQSEATRVLLSVHELNETKRKCIDLLTRVGAQENVINNQIVTINQKENQLLSCKSELLHCQERLKERERMNKKYTDLLERSVSQEKLIKNQLIICQSELLNYQKELKEQEKVSVKIKRELDQAVKRLAADEYDVTEVQHELLENTIDHQRNREIIHETNNVKRRMDYFSFLYD